MIGDPASAVREAPGQMLPYRFGPSWLGIWTPLDPLVQERELIGLEADHHGCALASRWAA
jgi:hypothetical protein